MAIIKTSGLITDINGSINGTTFQNSLGGLTMKSKSFQSKNYSMLANAQKATMSGVQNYWRNLSQADRDDWQVQAEFAPVGMKRGNGRKLSGQQLFIKYANWYAQQFSALPGQPVFAVEFIPTVSIRIQNVAGALHCLTNININEAVSFLHFEISSVMPASRKLPTGGTKTIELTFANSADVVFTNDYIDLFGAVPSVGSFVFVKARNISVTGPYFGTSWEQKVEVI